MNAKALLLLLAAASVLRGADASAPADFTIGTHVVAPSPPRIGLNLRDPSQYNSFTVDPGFEPITIKRQHTATGGGADYIDNVPANGPSIYSAGTWHYQTMADGFFDGAHVRVYRMSTSGLQFVREGTVANYVTNGWRRLHTLPLSVSQFTDTMAAPGVTYEYQIRAVNTSHVVSTNHSVDAAMATAAPLAGTSSATNTAFYGGSFYVRNTTPPAVPSGLAVTPQAGAVFLDWNDSSESDLAGYYVYRRTLGAPQFRIYLDSIGAPVQAGDIYFLEMTRDNAPVEFMHDRLGASHSPYATGYSPHANVIALQMRNQRVTGDMVATAAHGVPTIDVAQRANSSGQVVIGAMPNTPLIGVYAFRDGADYRVFVLSRKLTGSTPVTLRLPFTSISGGTIYKVTGDPRATNSDTLSITETQEPLGAFSQNYTFTMPAGSIDLLEFRGANVSVAANPSVEISRAPAQADPTTTPAVQFAVDFSRPVSGFTLADLQVGGTALAGATPIVTLAQGTPFLGTNYIVTVSNLAQDGTVTLALPAGAANAADDNTPTQAATVIDGSIDFAFPPPRNVVLAYDDFGAAPIANPQILHGVTTGAGWTQGWQVQNYNAATYTDGYKLGALLPLRPGSIRTLGSYAVGGRGYEMTTRALDVNSFGSFVAIGSNPAAIGQDGTTLWMSVLLRKETNDNAPVRFDLVNADGSAEFSRVDVGVGYYGTMSNAGGQRYWTLAVLRDVATSAIDFVQTNVPVVVGQPVLLVLKMKFGATDRFDLFVNPGVLGAAAPTTPDATWTTTGAPDIRFRSARFRTGLGLGFDNDGTSNGLNKGSLDEVRIGDSFAAVTPALAAVELWRQRRFGSWQNAGSAADSADPDGDGETNAFEYFFGGDPLVRDGSHRPACGLAQVNGESRLALTLACDPANTDTTYVIEATSDLAAGVWSTIASRAGAAAWVSEPGVAVQQSGNSATVTDSTALGSIGSRFLRIRAAR